MDLKRLIKDFENVKFAADQFDKKELSACAGAAIRALLDCDEALKEAKSNLDFQTENVEKWNRYAKQYLDEKQKLEGRIEQIRYLFKIFPLIELKDNVDEAQLRQWLEKFRNKLGDKKE